LVHPVGKQWNNKRNDNTQCWQRCVERTLSYNACGSLNWDTVLGVHVGNDSSSNDNDNSQEFLAYCGSVHDLRAHSLLSHMCFIATQWRRNCCYPHSPERKPPSWVTLAPKPFSSRGGGLHSSCVVWHHILYPYVYIKEERCTVTSGLCF
jgi:hypothetical protein